MFSFTAAIKTTSPTGEVAKNGQTTSTGLINSNLITQTIRIELMVQAPLMDNTNRLKTLCF